VPEPEPERVQEEEEQPAYTTEGQSEFSAAYVGEEQTHEEGREETEEVVQETGGEESPYGQQYSQEQTYTNDYSQAEEGASDAATNNDSEAASVDSGQYTPERLFIGGVAEATEEELQLMENYLGSLSHEATVADFRGVETVFPNTYSQVLVTNTKEELDTEISEYTESCKVVVFTLGADVFIGIAWQNDESSS